MLKEQGDEKVKDSRRIAEVKRGARDQLAKRHDKLLQLYDEQVKHVASFEKQKG